MSDQIQGIETSTELPEITQTLFLKQLTNNQAAINEINILIKCASQFVVQIHQIVIQNNNTETISIVFQNEGKDLSKYLIENNNPLPNASIIFSTIISAISYLHNEMVICHRDVKPSNVMYNQTTGRVCLIDFGYATDIHTSELLFDAVGSPGFYAPEMFLSNEGYNGAAADIWSCGVLYLELILGSELFEEHWMRHGPFDANNTYDKATFEVKMLRAIRSLRDLERNGTYSTDLGQIFRKTISLQPSRRYDVNELNLQLQSLPDGNSK